MIHEVSALPLVDAADDLVDVVHAELGEELLWHLVHLNVLAELDCLAVVVVVVVVYSITANAPISYWPTSWRFVEQQFARNAGSLVFSTAAIIWDVQLAPSWEQV